MLWFLFNAFRKKESRREKAWRLFRLWNDKEQIAIGRFENKDHRSQMIVEFIKKNPKANTIYTQLFDEKYYYKIDLPSYKATHRQYFI